MTGRHALPGMTRREATVWRFVGALATIDVLVAAWWLS